MSLWLIYQAPTTSMQNMWYHWLGKKIAAVKMRRKTAWSQPDEWNIRTASGRCAVETTQDCSAKECCGPSPWTISADNCSCIVKSSCIVMLQVKWDVGCKLGGIHGQQRPGMNFILFLCGTKWTDELYSPMSENQVRRPRGRVLLTAKNFALRILWIFISPFRLNRLL